MHVIGRGGIWASRHAHWAAACLCMALAFGLQRNIRRRGTREIGHRGRAVAVLRGSCSSASPPLLAAEARLAGDFGHHSQIREHREGEEDERKLIGVLP
jgi:hypothetical protein